MIRTGHDAYAGTMTNAESLADDINAALPRVKRGSLAVFGDIFGGRIDNIHTIDLARVVSEPERLVIEFDGGETLEVWDPVDWQVTSDIFRICRASRVRWAWFHYGRPQAAENRYFQDHRVADDKVTVRTNVDWHEPWFNPSLSKPAVELLELV